MNIPQSSDALLVPDWPAPPNVRAYVTTRRMPGNSLPPYDAFNLGLRSGESEATVLANRDLLVRALALPSPPRWLRQVHGADVVGFDCHRHAPPAEPEADAAVTRECGVVLAILTADCLPILLCAEDGSEVAAVHAGWRGLSAGVVEACVGAMTTPPERVLAWLGPAIGPASYEVGDEVRAAFLTGDAGSATAFAPTRPGHWSCDLYALARRNLSEASVRKIFGGDFDTRTDDRFYSYRRDHSSSGRFASLVWRTDGDLRFGRSAVI